MASVASRQIHRDDNKKQRAGVSRKKKKKLFKLEATVYICILYSVYYV